MVNGNDKYYFKSKVSSFNPKDKEIWMTLTAQPQSIDEIIDRLPERKRNSHDREILRAEVECFLTGLVDDGVLEKSATP